MAASTQEKIARRAYELYQQRGEESGNDFDDWLQAEQEILGKKQPAQDKEKAKRDSQAGKQNVEKAVAKTSKAKTASKTAGKSTKKTAVKAAPTKAVAIKTGAKKSAAEKSTAKKPATKKKSAKKSTK